MASVVGGHCSLADSKKPESYPNEVLDTLFNAGNAMFHEGADNLRAVQPFSHPGFGAVNESCLTENSLQHSSGWPCHAPKFRADPPNMVILPRYAGKTRAKPL